MWKFLKSTRCNLMLHSCQILVAPGQHGGCSDFNAFIGNSSTVVTISWPRMFSSTTKQENMLCVVIFQRQHNYKTLADRMTIAVDGESCQQLAFVDKTVFFNRSLPECNEPGTLCSLPCRKPCNSVRLCKQLHDAIFVHLFISKALAHRVSHLACC